MAATVIAIGADHAGYSLKDYLKAGLEGAGYQVLDCGTHTADSVDYPDFATAVAHAVIANRAVFGVLVCGTGIGMSMAANRHPGIRAAVCSDVTGARLARNHNDANILALGARVLGPEVAWDCLRTFLTTEFDGGDRHRRRLAKMG